jgi:hypothetical protein
MLIVWHSLQLRVNLYDFITSFSYVLANITIINLASVIIIILCFVIIATKSKENDHLEDQGVGGKMGSEWILGRLAWGMWI